MVLPVIHGRAPAIKIFVYLEIGAYLSASPHGPNPYQFIRPVVA